MEVQFYSNESVVSVRIFDDVRTIHSRPTELVTKYAVIFIDKRTI